MIEATWIDLIIFYYRTHKVPGRAVIKSGDSEASGAFFDLISDKGRSRIGVASIYICRFAHLLARKGEPHSAWSISTHACGVPTSTHACGIPKRSTKSARFSEVGRGGRNSHVSNHCQWRTFAHFWFLRAPGGSLGASKTTRRALEHPVGAHAIANARDREWGREGWGKRSVRVRKHARV